MRNVDIFLGFYVLQTRVTFEVMERGMFSGGNAEQVCDVRWEESWEIVCGFFFFKIGWILTEKWAKECHLNIN